MNDPTPQLIVSLASESDIPQLGLLINRAYRGDSSRKGWTTEADLLDGIRIDEARLKEILRHQDSELWVIKSGEQIFACVHLEVKADGLYLGMLTVEPALQNHGLGKVLINKAEERALERGLRRVFMTVISVRKPLIEWYLRNGYCDTGIKEPFPSNDPRFGVPKEPLEFVVLEKKL